jgi:hypothetical protein
MAEGEGVLHGRFSRRPPSTSLLVPLPFGRIIPFDQPAREFHDAVHLNGQRAELFVEDDLFELGGSSKRHLQVGVRRISHPMTA